MSQPIRFRGQNHWEDSNGEWIKYSDYAALAAENERLRKAGDAMASWIKYEDEQGWESWGNTGPAPANEYIQEWNAAKKGKDAK